MPEEYLDIVDSNNKPTGQVRPRAEVHSSGLWHRTVHVYFFRKSNDNLQFLVHQRSLNKDLSPGRWDTRFGGHIKSGQALSDTLTKELREEVGVEVKITELIEGPFVKREHYPNNEFAKIYFYEFGGDEHKLRFHDSEIQQVKWMNAQEILRDVKENLDHWSMNIDEFEDVIVLFNKVYKKSTH